MDNFKLGITGAGSFAHCFIPLFQAHPGICDVVLAEVLPDRRSETAERFGIKQTYESHKALCESDVDAIAIFTQRHLHGPQSIEALNHGKHVYCAVPAANSLTQIKDLVSTVEKTGQIYMSGETSYYYPSALFCRNKYEAGEFGHFVYAEGEYLHDMSHGFYEAYQHSGGAHWQRVAGIPPMHYPTHSTSMFISVTGEHLTRVACLGYRDRSDDQVFGEGMNHWDNPFSNQTALFNTTNGGMFRVNEFRRVGHGLGNCVRASMYGTQGCFEEQGNALVWTDLDRNTEDLWDKLQCAPEDPTADHYRTDGDQEDFYSGTCSIHPVDRLPESFLGLPNGHYGSHQFLVHDFVLSVLQNKLAPNHIWAAARYLIPGLMAHESAMRNGAWMDIPDLGGPAPEAAYIEYG